MVYAKNDRALFDYQILETLETGLVLFGPEVKAVKSNKVSLRGSYVKILNQEAWLLGAHISPYQANNSTDDYDPQRTRKILLNKKEVNDLWEKTQSQGLTIVPLKLYSKNNLIKLEIALARGKKKYDKRETIKKREVERKIRHQLKV